MFNQGSLVGSGSVVPINRPVVGPGSRPYGSGSLVGSGSNVAVPRVNVRPAHASVVNWPTGSTASAQTAAAASDAPTAEEVAAAQAAAEAAALEAKRSKLRGKAKETLDEIANLYKEIMARIREAGADQTNRINQSYDGKVANQYEDMNNGMYAVDAAAAANNLADSSFRSFDRGKVRNATEDNVDVLNEARQGDLGKLGQSVTEDTALYNSKLEGIDPMRQQLGDITDVDQLQKTVNNFDATRRGAQADEAKYGPRGSFVAAANKLGNYDTSNLEKALQSVVSNASAPAANKQAAINDLLNGTTGLDKKKKDELKTKYTQVIG